MRAIYFVLIYIFLNRCRVLYSDHEDYESPLLLWNFIQFWKESKISRLIDAKYMIILLFVYYAIIA